MPFVVPIHAQVQLNSQRVEDELILLVEIEDSTLAETRRFCSRPVDRISSDPLQYGLMAGGYQYIYAVSGTIPSDEEHAQLQTTIVIDNVDQLYTDELLALTVYNSVTLKVVLGSDPDTNLRDIPLLYITNVAAGVDNLTLTLERNPVVVGAQSNLEPWPSGLQTIVNAPGLHRQ